MMTGMNEAIMNQNDQMRMRILEQNQKLKEVRYTNNEVLSLFVSTKWCASVLRAFSESVNILL